jgi:hypothetical protein
MSQAPPTPGREEVAPLAMAWLQRRVDAGREKYGTPLMTFNGRYAILDALEESADKFFYLFQECRERGIV